MITKSLGLALMGAASLFVASQANADIVDIPQSAFQANAGLITFSEYADGTENPVYPPAVYGGGASAPTVSFGGFFLGQSLGTDATCPSGAAVSGCVVGTPTGPLALDPTSPATFITDDGAMPTTPILSGSPTYNGPIAIEFSTPQTGVGLTGGYFDAVGSTGITAYDAQGNVLGTVSNTETGDEFLGLETTDHSAKISGLLFHLVGDEPFGFDVDNIEFGVGDQVAPVSGAPEPGTWALLMAGVAGVGFALRQAKKSGLALANAMSA